MLKSDGAGLESAIESSAGLAFAKLMRAPRSSAAHRWRQLSKAVSPRFEVSAAFTSKVAARKSKSDVRTAKASASSCSGVHEDALTLRGPRRGVVEETKSSSANILLFAPRTLAVARRPCRCAVVPPPLLLSRSCPSPTPTVLYSTVVYSVVPDAIVPTNGDYARLERTEKLIHKSAVAEYYLPDFAHHEP